MKRVPNVREVMDAVQTAVQTSSQEKLAADIDAPSNFVVETSQQLEKLARKIRRGNFAPVTYNDVMEFGSFVKKAVNRESHGTT